MPFGVSQDFLNLLSNGKRRGLLALIPLAVAGFAGGFVAEMLDPGRGGAYVWLYTGSMLAGLLVGGLAGYRLIDAWSESLRESWTDWMHSAVGAGTVSEAAERAGAPAFDLDKALTAVLVAANAAVLIAAWFQLPPFTFAEPYGGLAIVTVASTGLVVGGRAAVGLAEAWWCREIEDQTRELVQKGRVGVWGIR